MSRLNWDKLLKDLPVISNYDVKNDLKNNKSLEERMNGLNDSISLDELKNSVDDTYNLFSRIVGNIIKAMEESMYILYF